MDKVLNYALIVVALIIVCAVAYLAFNTENYGGELVLGTNKISNYEGSFKLLNAENISLVMDVRNISQENRVSVFQCGVGFASSLASIGKNVTSFAIEEDGCYGPMNHTSVEKCNELMHQGSYILLLKGGSPDAQYYEDHLLVSVPENNTHPCGVNITSQQKG